MLLNEFNNTFVMPIFARFRPFYGNALPRGDDSLGGGNKVLPKFTEKLPMTFDFLNPMAGGNIYVLPGRTTCAGDGSPQQYDF